MHFCIAVFEGEDAHPPRQIFADVALPLRHALARLGYQVEIRTGETNPLCANIILGAGLAAQRRVMLPAKSILFNLDQYWNREEAVLPPLLAGLFKEHMVWDFSPRNIAWLEAAAAVKARHMPLGYTPEMTRLKRDYPQDIDLLFYGTLTKRRKSAIDALARTSLKVAATSNDYDRNRDFLIARSKAVLNIHAEGPATLELPRLGYLWANEKPVICELHEGDETFAGLEDACVYCDYDALLPTALTLLKKGGLEQQGEKGFAAFSRREQAAYLKEALGGKVFTTGHGQSSVQPLPDKINAGSGADFRLDCLNVDIEARKNPDLVLDLSLPLDPQTRYETLRFGEIQLQPGSFSHITALEVLEHIRDLPQMMRNFLDLLKDGGELEISVPYDLSQGAWQDPTHVRAFNERSWIYYCDWAGYLGWRDFRFARKNISYILNKEGMDMSNSGEYALERILAMPRVVNGMKVILQKRASTEEEKHIYDFNARNYYENAVGGWSF